MATSLENCRFYAILDTAYVTPENWVDVYRALLDGPADLIQLRAKAESHAERVLLMEALLPDYGTSGCPLIINDDLEAAALYPGMNLGLHVGQEDTPPETARSRLGPNAIIGLSTHSREQAAQAMELGREGIIDYFAVGPLFQTPTKPEADPVGLELAAWVMEQNPPVPFFCIGGITRASLDLVLQHKIRRIAVVSDVLTDPSPWRVVAEYQRRLQ